MVEIYLNNKLLDLGTNEDFQLNINYVVQDIRNIGKTNSSYTKSIILPHSENNNQIFSNIFDFNLLVEDTAPSFNPLKKADVKIYDSGLLLMTGYLKLDEINISKDLTNTYNCTIYSSISDLFTDLSKIRLSDLDFSEFNHEYNIDNVAGSWSDYIVKYNSKTAFKLGNGYVYPYIDFGYNQNDISNGTIPTSDSGNTRPVEFFRPSLYTKEIVNKIFNKAGYTYESEFFETNYFKSLITVPPLKGSYYSPDIIDNSKLLASLDTTHTYPLNNYAFGSYVTEVGVAEFDNDFDNGNYDNGSNYNNTLFEYTVPIAGKYQVLANVIMTTAFGDLTYFSGDVVTRTIGGNIDYKVDIYLKRGLTDTIIGTQLLNKTLNFTQTVNYMSIPQITVAPSVTYTFNEGDVIYAKMSYVLHNVHMYNIIGQEVSAGVYFKQVQKSFFRVNLVNEPIYETADYNMNNLLPNDFCSDYLKGLTKMFNLVFEQDSFNPKKIYIEPRNQFFKDTAVDWTYKFDRSNEAKIIPISEIQDKSILFSYQEDNDYFNNKYQDEFKETYGQYKYDSNNEFADISSVYENIPIFAPTELVTETYLNSPTDKVISTIYSITNDNTVHYDNSKLRILFYNGLIPCDDWVISTRKTSSEVLTGGTINTGTTRLDIPITDYPYAGHLDNPYTPSNDLNYWFPKTYYFQPNNITNSNLFNKFWKDFIDDFYTKDSKLFVGYFRLTSTDIFNFSFRNIVYFDRKYWIVNKIIDFNPLSEGVTKVELLSIENYGKIKNFVSADEKKFNVDLGGFVFKKDDEFRTISPPISILTSNTVRGFSNLLGDVQSTSNVVLGNSNILGSSTLSNIVSGNKNLLGSSNSSVILGDSNIFISGLKNAMIVGENNDSDFKLVNSFVVGDNNSLSSTTNSFVFGNNNTLSGVTDSLIVGSGLTLNDISNQAYFQKSYIQSLTATTISANTISATTLSIDPTLIPAPGLDNYIIYNKNGYLGASQDFYYDSTNEIFRIGKPSNTFLSVNKQTKTYQIGDVNNVNNGTLIKLVDSGSTSSINFSASTFNMNGNSGYTGTVTLSAITQFIITNGIITGVI